MTRTALGHRHQAIAAKTRAFVQSYLARIQPIPARLDLDTDRLRVHGVPRLVDLDLRSRNRRIEKHHRPANVHGRPLFPSNIAQFRHHPLHVTARVGMHPLHKDPRPLEVRGARGLLPQDQGHLICAERNQCKILRCTCQLVVVPVGTGPLVQRLPRDQHQWPARRLRPDLHNSPLSHDRGDEITHRRRSQANAGRSPMTGLIHFLDGLRCAVCNTLDVLRLDPVRALVECSECGQTALIVTEFGEGRAT
ncbi:hypothetical protein SAMN05421811_102314 [Nonomuraea wenchangensis]|uniref:Uncharacterized protein n=1 Tax=Nonomuraea wenchangensis TaxID=568860 RepID=A0A1I0CH73_9ACTN|nr:hypothetical protein SAMN05421811_102314 [Nonomuraea wenchangensis]